MNKIKVAIFWAASCGGCDISFLDLHENLLHFLEKIEFVFWPCVMDVKFSDLDKILDKSIDITFFNGAIRNSENKEKAILLRKKSKLLISYGACSSLGGIPALSNLYNNKLTFDSSYISNDSVNNPNNIVPQTKTTISNNHLEIPELYDYVAKLDDIVQVDYYIAGCPPEAYQVFNVLSKFLDDKLPPIKTVLGAGSKNLCDECSRKKIEKKINKFYRPQEIEYINPNDCLLEQGLICSGPATRSGCGAKCPAVNLGCRGCYGPPDDVSDQGLKLLSALSSIVEAVDEDEIKSIVNNIKDLIGYSYRFSLSSNMFKDFIIKNQKLL